MTKIDYEITVDVSGADVETKKRVQDAFFKLGFKWRTEGYKELDKNCYTNKVNDGRINERLMYVVNRVMKTTHTIDELLELAGMENKTKLFNLEKALAGEPVVTRDGRKAYIRHHETLLETKYPLFGYILRGRDDNETITWTVDGANYADAVEGSLDIVGMWKDPLVFEYWDKIAPEFTWIAKDETNSWYAFPGEPEAFVSEWQGLSQWLGKGSRCLSVLSAHLFPACDWKDSLIKRPENE